MVGGYLLCNSLAGSVEGAVFGNTFSVMFSDYNIPAWVFTTILVLILMITNLNGVDVFIKVQDFVAYALIGSLVIMGLLGTFGIGTGEVVNQPAVLASDFKSVTGLCGLAFFLFVGGEYVIPLTKNCKNAKRDIPLGMITPAGLNCHQVQHHRFYTERCYLDRLEGIGHLLLHCLQQ